MFRKKIIIGLLAAFVVCGLVGCNKLNVNNDEEKNLNNRLTSKNLTAEVENKEISSIQLDDEFIEETASFSIELFKNSVIGDLSEGKNVLLSPESVKIALSMTANGAGGDTLAQMENVIAGGMDISEYNKYMHTYMNNIGQSKNIKFNLANSIWVKDNEDIIKVKDEFLNVCGNYYDADVFAADFDESTVKDINTWVNQETNNMIPIFLEEIPKEAVMYLINAIAFEGEWLTPYEEYQIDENGIFTSFSGEEQKVNMLCSTEEYYIEDEVSIGFLKYYEDRKFAFMAILPKEEGDISGYVAGMTGDDFLDLFENREFEDVIVRMPEFTYEYDTELSEPLKDMGMAGAFEDTADFSNMAATETGKLYINRVLHKTYIQVDRAGTKAAAATAVEMVCESCVEPSETPKEVILDRPFVYAIVDTGTGLPVFMGVVNSVE